MRYVQELLARGLVQVVTEDVALLESEIGDLAFEKRKIMEHLALGSDALCLRYFGGMPDHTRVKARAYDYHGADENIRRYSRERYTKARGRIERKLSRFHKNWNAR
jgi:hypothetical protein